MGGLKLERNWENLGSFSSSKSNGSSIQTKETRFGDSNVLETSQNLHQTLPSSRET
jgi:hypothetical protein